MLEKIDEVKYLSVENSYRYRQIMRFFFNKYEQAEYWLYKEDVFDALKDVIVPYSIIECERDLQFLVENKSLVYLQDVQNINTLDDFRYHNFRYQMTDQAVIIERMTIQLEQIEVKITNLEPRLFERINSLIRELVNVYDMSEEKIYEVWTDLNNDFVNLNDEYQDFLKKFHEARTEELLQSTIFLEFKNSMVNYLSNFVSSYIKSSKVIKSNLLKLDEDKVSFLMKKLLDYQKKIPGISPQFNYDKLNSINYGKYLSIKKWFVSSGNLCEGDRLLNVTEGVITKISKYANSLMELHGNMINRKEEYKHICHLFDSCTNLEEANVLSQSIFGIINTLHYKGNSNINTDLLVRSYEVEPIIIDVNSNVRDYKVKKESVVLKDKSEEKIKLMQKKMEAERREREELKCLINKAPIMLTGSIDLSVLERRYVLDLIDKYHGSGSKENKFGYEYLVETLPDECVINSPDGKFVLEGKKISILVGEDK